MPAMTSPVRTLLLAIFAAAGLAAGCAKTEDVASNSPPPTRSGRPRGVAADPGADFVQGCSGCHGSKGIGGRGPKLAGKRLPIDKIAATIRDGKGQKMPSFKLRYVPARIEALAEYVHNL